MKIDGRLDDNLSQEIPGYERFFKAVGFKRLEGTLYGFLVLSKEPVTSEQIRVNLGLSQGAVSQGLNRLAEWGAVESRYSSEKRAQLHHAAEDSLKVVATIFQKREREAISGFKAAARRSIERCREAGDLPTDPRILRLKSIVLTCEVAEAFMNFAINIAGMGTNLGYSQIIKALPRTLDLLVTGGHVAKGMTARVKTQLNAVIRQSERNN